MFHNEKLDKLEFISRTINENQICSENSSFLISEFVSKIKENGKLLRNSDEVLQYVEYSDNKGGLADFFIRTLKDKSNYTQIKYANSEGRELVSVKKSGDDFITNFEEDIKSESVNNWVKPVSDDVSISSLNINTGSAGEGNEFNSTLVIKIPVFDKINQFSGMIVVDYLLNDFIYLIQNYSLLSESGIYGFSIYNKNDDGIYTISNEYKFNNEGEARELQSDLAIELTSLLEKQKAGFVQNNDHLITYFDIFSDFNRGQTNKNEKWVLTNTYNLNELYSFCNIKNYLFSAFGFYLLFLLTAAFYIAGVLNKLKINEDELCVLNRIAETTTDAVVVTDTEKNILFVNKSVEDCSGFKMDELEGKNPYMLVSNLNNSKVLDKTKTELCEASKWNGTVWFKKKNGIIYPNKLHIFKVGNKVDETHYVGIFSSLTNSQVRTATNKIGCKESNLLVDMLNKVLKPNEKYIILYIALDNYNSIIDLFNEQKINILDYFVELILPFKKDTDVIAKAGKNKVFAVLNISEITESAEEHLNGIYKSLSKILHIGGDEACFKIRIGASIYPDDTTDTTSLYKNTLIALQWSSFEGANNISFYNPEMLEKVKKERQIEYHLRLAIAKKELYMVYQPQVDISTGKMVGMEALVRWNNEILGNVPPAIFIPIAEKNRMMVDLGYWIIERTCSDLNHLFNVEKVDSSLRCAINISALQLDDTKFLETLYSVIEKNNLNYSNIEIEITENLFLEQSQNTIAILKDINSKGITIAIDDFGTGYSSLSYLNSLPVDKIKIDRGFIKDYPHKDDGELAKILIKMSKTLNKVVLTEGAETEEQVNYLKGIGCEFIQGYYYSKPLKRTHLMDYINKK
jgi:PAS domain S-box-containing protein